MKTTKIEWTDKTWNPITGCTKFSTGCKNCYAETMSHRIQTMGLAKYKNGFLLTLHHDSLKEPLKWRKPHRIFVCSMSDLFHEDVPFSFVDKVLDTIQKTPHHHYQILTKRAIRMADYFSSRPVPTNVWLGVTVECSDSTPRIDALRQIDASIRFLSCEPLVGDLGKLNLTAIHWVIVGGESGPKARPMQKNWAISIKEQAIAQGCDFFFKQWGSWGADGVKRSKLANGKLLDGQLFLHSPALS